MQKQIKVTLKSGEQTVSYETKAIWMSAEKKWKWYEEDSLHTLFLLDLQKKEIIRENKELKMLLTFDKKKDTIMNCKWKGLAREMEFVLKIKEEKETETALFLSYETYHGTERLDTYELEILF